MSFRDPDGLRHAPDGAQRVASLLDGPAHHALCALVATLPPDQAGLRVHGVAALAPLLSPTGPIGRLAAQMIGTDGCRPVRAVLFDKSATRNWALGWHQDRTIAVQHRIEVDGFGPWSLKRGVTHVEPPFDILAGMLTVRVHLDAVPATNAPLLIAPGSHRLGRVPAAQAADAAARCGTVACLAEAGDAWVYATPILHASHAAVAPTHRRVLQIDFAARALPGGLCWLGV